MLWRPKQIRIVCCSYHCVRIFKALHSLFMKRFRYIYNDIMALLVIWLEIYGNTDLVSFVFKVFIVKMCVLVLWVLMQCSLVSEDEIGMLLRNVGNKLTHGITTHMTQSTRQLWYLGSVPRILAVMVASGLSANSSVNNNENRLAFLCFFL